MSEDARPPVDDLAERGLVGAVLVAGSLPDDVRGLLRTTDVWNPSLRAVLEVAWDTDKIDPIIVRTELLRRGHRGSEVDGAWLYELIAGAMPAHAVHYARTVRDMAVRRDVAADATRALVQVCNPSLDPFDVAASLHVAAGLHVDRADPPAPSHAVDLHTFIAGSLDYDWLIPELLERGDRVLITAGEGHGKSVLLRQLAVCAAAGVHPFSGVPHAPLRVLLVDLENGERTLRRHLIRLSAHAQAIGHTVPASGLMVESVPAGVDLTQASGEAWLTHLCEDVQPQVLSIGPLYRMHVADVGKEEPARQLTRVIDSVRARHGCAVLMETHAPHGGTMGARDLRPIGSSLFRRWPEFGFGIRAEDDGGNFKLVRWRGPRDERTGWPRNLAHGKPGQEWPWKSDDEPVGPLSSSIRRYWSDVDRGAQEGMSA